jgi:transposase
VAKRYELTDAQWERIADLLPGKARGPGRTAADNRLFVNGCGALPRRSDHQGSHAGRRARAASQGDPHPGPGPRRHGRTGAPRERAEGGSVIADRGYDTNEVRALIAKAGMKAVIPSRRSRNTPIPHDPILYRARNRIERCFNKLKHFRRFATRFDRRDLHFLSFIHLASAMLWMR